MFKNALIIAALFLCSVTYAQPVFTHADSLRGSLNENRDWFDIQRYDIRVIPHFETKSIEGEVHWTATAVKPAQKIQVDLQQPLIIDSVIYTTNGRKSLSFKREGNVAIVDFKDQPNLNSNFDLIIYYHGVPREAVRPPWDGGWIWRKDSNGKPWMSVACQGIGASVWYPCKDHQSDEPDKGASITMIVPDSLYAIGNGRRVLLKTEEVSGKKTFQYEVVNPINNYTIIPYIGDYVGWKETYKGLNGDLDLSYWVLREDSAKAVKQFTQVPKMLKAFEYWFGPYPFYEDGYQLIQAPHLGMEHQSAVAYGNKFENGYLGRDLSGSGWGKKWDFIIVHESGHEWFANNITTKDMADMWVHEGFTNYSETLFTEYYYGVSAGNDYNFGSRRTITNTTPIIGYYGVNNEGSQDMYAKGGSLLHTIRHSINNDKLFRSILVGLNETYYHKTVTTQEIENYISVHGKFNFEKVFDQYLRTTKIPVFSYSIDRNEKILTYQWKNCVVGFDLPIRFNYFGNEIFLRPIDYVPQKKSFANQSFDIDEFIKELERNYYIKAVEEHY